MTVHPKRAVAHVIVAVVRALLWALVRLGFHKLEACGCCKGPLEDDRDAVCHGCTRKPLSTSPRPLWRWWLFCASLWLSWLTEWEWTWSLMSWCVLPEWLGDGADCSGGTGEVPF